MAEPFKFKQFTVHQDRCAMKVGTDGVLLGAWASLAHNPNSILDIGAGTGVIALQLAQRSLAQTIDAIEIDDDAYEQCVTNFEASPWADRLFCYHASLDEFAEEIDETYDLVISNPPFYSEAVSSGDKARDMARQNQSLPFQSLLACASKLLATAGVFATVIPFREEAHFLHLAKANNLFVSKKTYVKGNKDAAIKRILIEFSQKKAAPTVDELIIEKGRHEYTDAYKNLTKAFYLKM